MTRRRYREPITAEEMDDIRRELDDFLGAMARRRALSVGTLIKLAQVGGRSR